MQRDDPQGNLMGFNPFFTVWRLFQNSSPICYFNVELLILRAWGHLAQSKVFVEFVIYNLSQALLGHLRKKKWLESLEEDH